MNLIKHQGPDIDKIYLHCKDPFESKYQLLTKGKKVAIETLINPKALIDYSETNADVHENLKHYNPTKERRVLMVFDDIMADHSSLRSGMLFVLAWVAWVVC